jgi:O-antigen ligase
MSRGRSLSIVRVVGGVNFRGLQGTLFSVSLLSVVVLAPLLILPGLLLYFDVTPKVVVVLVGTAAALLLAGRGSRLRAPCRRAFQVLLVAQGVSLLVSTCLSVSPLLSLTGTNWRRFGLVVQCGVLLFAWLCARHLSDGQVPGSPRVIALLRATAVSGGLVASYGVAQYSGWDPWLPSAAYHAGEDVWTIVRPPATLGHAGYFSTYLLFAVFSAVGLAMIERSRSWRLVGIAAAALGAAAIVLAGSRGALLGLAVAALVLVCWVRPRVRAKTVALVAVALLGSSLAFYFSPASQRIRGRVHWSMEDPLGGARLFLWMETLRMSGAHWAAGTGPETFTAQFARVQSAALARAYPDFHHESPHNMFLEALAAQGIAGPVILLLLCGLVFCAAARARSREPRLSGALLASFAGVIVSQQFQGFVIPSALCFFTSAAMLVTLEPVTSCEIEPRRQLPRWVSLGMAAGVALLLTVFAVRLAVADRSLFMIKAYLDTGQLREAVAEHARLLRQQPPGANFELWYSRALLVYAQKPAAGLSKLEAFREALDAAIRATRSSEEPHNAFYNLAAAFAVWNDYPRAVQSLRQAILASPTWYKPHWLLAKILQQAGFLAEAQEEAELACNLAGGKHGEVTQDRLEIAKLLGRK